MLPTIAPMVAPNSKKPIRPSLRTNGIRSTINANIAPATDPKTAAPIPIMTPTSNVEMCPVSGFLIHMINALIKPDMRLHRKIIALAVKADISLLSTTEPLVRP